jgi:signal recognition particle receptor subunit beta
MVQINFAKSEVQCKIVYYGPACAGKTANLHSIHEQAPSHIRGALTSIATDTNRTLFFDFLPLNIGNVAGIRTKVQLYAVPYKENQNSLRVLVLQGVDGLVFVADRSKSHLENRNALTNLYDNLKALGRDPTSIPLVFQWNKSDLPNVHAPAEMNQALNPTGHPAFPACATTGMGVFATLKALTQQVLLNVSRTVAGREAVERVIDATPQPAARPVPQPARQPVPRPPAQPEAAPAPAPQPDPEPVPVPIAAREPLPPLAEADSDPEPDWLVDSGASPLDVLTPPFVDEPEPDALPPLNYMVEPEPEPEPLRAPAMEFDDVELPPEPPPEEPEAPFTPPWRLKHPESKPAVMPGSVPARLDTREFGRTTTSFDDRPLPPPPPEPPPPQPEMIQPAPEEPWQDEQEEWPVGEPPAAPEELDWGDAPRIREPARARKASAPYGGDWSAIDAHGRRRVTHELRDARPVIDRRKRPRDASTKQRSNDLPLPNLITGSLVALACLIVTGFLVHTLL